MLRERWLIVVAAVAVTMAAAGVYTTQQQPEYESTATVQLLWNQSPGSSGSLPDLDTSSSVATGQAVAEQVQALVGPVTAALLSGVTAAPNVDAATMTYTVTAKGDTAASQLADAYATRFVALLKNRAETAVNQLEQRRSDLLQQIADYQSQLDGLDEEDQNQLVQTQLSVALESYSGMSAQIEAATFAGPPAEVASGATSPRSTALADPIVLAIAALIGLMAGVGLALLRHEFDTRIRSIRDVRAATDAPLLAEVPDDPGEPDQPHALPVLDPAPSPFTNGVRTVRTAVQAQQPSPGTVILVTSPEPGAGKTFVTANLAASWALSGKETVVVSGDLRHPDLDHYFPAGDDATPPTRGRRAAEPSEDARNRTASISTTAAHQDSDDLLRPTAIEGLSLFSAFTTSGNPSDLLASELIADVMTELRKIAHYVVIDAPPALAVADPLILASHADGVVIVAAVGTTTRPALAKTVDMFRVDHSNLLGVVLNRTKPRPLQGYTTTDAEPRTEAPRGREQDRADATSDANTGTGTGAGRANGNDS